MRVARGCRFGFAFLAVRRYVGFRYVRCAWRAVAGSVVIGFRSGVGGEELPAPLLFRGAAVFVAVLVVVLGEGAGFREGQGCRRWLKVAEGGRAVDGGFIEGGESRNRVKPPSAACFAAFSTSLPVLPETYLEKLAAKKKSALGFPRRK